MLLDGELDAGIVGDALPDPRLKYLIPNPDEAAKQVGAVAMAACRSTIWW